MSTTQTPTGTPPPSTERAGWWQRQTTTARVLVVAVPLLVVVLLVVVFFPRSPQPAETLPATTGTSQRANACLGGSSDLNSAVQYAQANAPLTGTGAAEFAATLVRWTNAAPDPTPAQKKPLFPKLVTSESLPSFPDVPSENPVAGASIHSHGCRRLLPRGFGDADISAGIAGYAALGHQTWSGNRKQDDLGDVLAIRC